ncbi:MAG: PIG-L family deacetylase [Vicinamibacterales bacterium]
MRRRWTRLLAGAALAATALTLPRPVLTQVTPLPLDEGATGLGLALRQLPVEGSVLYVTAHPDDENNGVLVALGRGRGLKTALLTTTRGDGGQNEIGPELFQAIGILRTEELAGVHQWDGAKQFFTRAFEFGYSFSVEETFEKWGKEEILRDMVRVIRRERPDVILTMPREGPGGGQHHMASAQLAHEAFRAAADPARFPEQIREGLRPWQARKVYQSAGGPLASDEGGTGAVRVPTGDYDPLLGMSWAQAGQMARAYHRCQGMGQLEAFPGEASGSYALYDSAPAVTGREQDIMDGVDTSLRRLASFAGAERSSVPSLETDLAAIEAAGRDAIDAFNMRAPQRTLPYIARGLTRVRQLRQAVAASPLSADPKAEILWRLDRKAADFEKALGLAQGLEVHVLAADGDVVRGQTVQVAVQVYNTGAEPMTLDGVDLHVPAGWSARLTGGAPGALAYNQSASLVYDVTVGADARYTQPYWKRNLEVDRYDLEVPADQTLPWSPAAVRATVRYTAGGVAATHDADAYYRYDGPWVGGEKQKIVNVVPAVSVTLTPGIGVVPLDAGGRPREFRVTVLNNLDATPGGPTTVRLEAPSGWSVTPASATLDLSLEGQQMTARFMVTPPARLSAGTVEIRAVASRDGVDYREGYQVIAYDHIQERHLFHPATSTVKLFAVTVPANLQVGYVMGTGDEVPEALRQLGATVTMLGPDDVAFGDLSRFQTIVLGIRAYESRADVRAYNQRLLDFAREGGHLVVQYNKVAMNQLGAGAEGGGGRGFVAQAAGAPAPAGGRGFGGGGRGRGGAPNSPYVPYPGGITSNRITVEQAPIRVLEDGTAELSSPNRITQADFQGWVQERGLYFFGANDPRYTDILAATDPWEKTPGEKEGMLTTATVGRGTWTYVGLGLWRQLPAGVPGAYRIMANLISRPRNQAGR